MPGKSTKLDQSPMKDAVLQDIAEGRLSDAAIARKYGLGDATIGRYRKKYFPDIVRASSLREREGILNAIATQITRVTRMLDALDEWATDPSDSTRYFMGPRADEVYVCYTKMILQETVPKKAAGNESEDGKEGEKEPPKVNLKPIRIRVKENLQDVIDRCFSDYERAGMRLYSKTSDSRFVLLKATETLGKYLELLLKAKEALSAEGGMGDHGDDVMMQELIDIIQEALEPYPEAQEALMSAIEAYIQRKERQREAEREGLMLAEDEDG